MYNTVLLSYETLPKLTNWPTESIEEFAHTDKCKYAYEIQFRVMNE